jgi:hypothetical protein
MGEELRLKVALTLCPALQPFGHRVAAHCSVVTEHGTLKHIGRRAEWNAVELKGGGQAYGSILITKEG